MSSTDQRSHTTKHTTETSSTTPSEAREMIAILDYGSQYSRLIARRVRECRVYCELLPAATTLADLERLETTGAGRVKGVILSGGPDSVYDLGARQVDQAILESDLPVLGICYGMQLFAHQMGGHVEPHTGRREYGPAEIWLEPVAAAAQSMGAAVARTGETGLAPTARVDASNRSADAARTGETSLAPTASDDVSSASAQADVMAQPSAANTASRSSPRRRTSWRSLQPRFQPPGPALRLNPSPRRRTSWRHAIQARIHSPASSLALTSPAAPVSPSG